jgi:integral membrane protein DUF106
MLCPELCITPGTPVARLPFEPISWFTRITHRGLPGTDMTEGAHLIIYVLTSMFVKVWQELLASAVSLLSTAILFPFSYLCMSVL